MYATEQLVILCPPFRKVYVLGKNKLNNLIICNLLLYINLIVYVENRFNKIVYMPLFLNICLFVGILRTSTFVNCFFLHAKTLYA